MDDKTLKKANEIAQMIRENKSALCCFEWEEEYGGGSRNPQLIIEFDDSDGSEQQKIQINWHLLPVLSDILVDMIKQAIDANLSVLKSEFESL